MAIDHPRRLRNDKTFPKSNAVVKNRTTFALGCVDIQVMPACKWRLSPLPALTYPNVCCVPVLEIHHFRLGLT